MRERNKEDIPEQEAKLQGQIGETRKIVKRGNL
uniref:Uncharacterized protein n=1 Tax=Rhizophora mucronata TaxID=61149 RepID=A0A2P2IXE5_RHIMU